MLELRRRRRASGNEEVSAIAVPGTDVRPVSLLDWFLRAMLRPTVARGMGMAALVFVGFLPVIVPNYYWTQVATDIWLYSMLAIAVNVVTGYAGMLTLGHAAFYGFGAYVVGFAMLRSGITWVLAFFLAGALTALLGLVVALPCLRVQSDFLGLVTIAFGSLFGVFAINWVSITGGPSGLAGVTACHHRSLEAGDQPGLLRTGIYGLGHRLLRGEAHTTVLGRSCLDGDPGGLFGGWHTWHTGGVLQGPCLRYKCCHRRLRRGHICPLHNRGQPHCL